MIAKIRARLAILQRLERPRDYVLLLRIFGLALITPWLMRLPLARTSRLLTPARAPVVPDQRRIAQIITYTDAVLRAFRPLVQERCLTRGVTLYYFLQRNGLAVALQFGAGFVDQTFAAHCWLVHEGKPFAEAHDPDLFFKPTYRIDGVKR